MYCSVLLPPVSIKHGKENKHSCWVAGGATKSSKTFELPFS
jgi:hypothetical protein